MTVEIYTDGGARGNPGPAGIGVVLLRVASASAMVGSARGGKGGFQPDRQAEAFGGQDDKGEEVLYEHGEYIGSTTNNQAEYRALIRGLQKAKELGAREVRCFLDSELLVKQMRQEYRVRNKELAPLFIKAWNLAHGFQKATFTHIPREKNKQADALVNKALDAQSAFVG